MVEIEVTEAWLLGSSMGQAPKMNWTQLGSIFQTPHLQLIVQAFHTQAEITPMASYGYFHTLESSLQSHIRVH